ncbi:MAG: glycosyltransferase [Flavobacteriales bacterium]|nr:glycosyltransferase [Flavobacteriales bacterium]HRW89125.1 glycosyltransferase [Flavobacteriales bacterium]
MKRPQVLVFIDWYLPGFRAGGPVRSLANLVDHLRDRVDLHIVTTDTDYTQERPYPDVQPDQWTALPGGERVWYASRKGVNKEAWNRVLREREWDAVYINGIYSRWFSIEPLRLSRNLGPKRVVAVRGMLAEGPMRHGALKKRAFLSLARLTGLYRGVRFQATNSEEMADIRRWVGRDAEVRLVPNLPRKVPAQAPGSRVKVPGELRLVSLARIAVEKNTLLAIEALRGLKGRVRFDLYGPIYDTAYWERCQQAMDQLPEGVQVTHLGVLPPRDVPAVLAGYHACLMPSAGENFGHTMLEALTQGVPLVTSDRTPWRDLEAEHAGWDLSLGGTGRFTEVVQLLVDMDQKAYEPWAIGAWNRAKRALDDPTTVERTFDLLAR